MSGDGDRPDPARGWSFVEGLLAKDELARLEKLEEKELDGELRKAGIDPERVPSAEQLVARAEERARAKRVDPARGWKFVEKLLDEERPRPVPSADDLVARAEARAKARGKAQAPPRPRRIAAYLAAVIAAVVLLLLVMNRAAIVAYFRGDEIRPDDEWLPWRPTPTPEERAAATREEAFTACAAAEWSQCQRKLDEAAMLDPAGESAPRVVAVRAAILAAQVPDAGKKPKPPLPP